MLRPLALLSVGESITMLPLREKSELREISDCRLRRPALLGRAFATGAL
jgi:hypothetical protein